MGYIDDEPLVAEIDFYPEADVFDIWVSKKSRKSTRDGKPITVQYWEGCWDIPEEARQDGDTRKRPQVTASSTASHAEAEEKCRQKVLEFWLSRTEGIRQEQVEKRPAALTREQRRAGYTVKSFLEEYVRSKTNPNTAPQNRWKDNTAKRAKTMLEMWIYPDLGHIPLTSLTHEQVRLHFTETLPNVLDDNDQRRLGDRRIRGIYSVFRAGLNRAGAKGLMEPGEFLDIGIQMTFEPAGVPEDIDNLLWEMNALLRREDVINDPLALRWALAYGQALRRGERCGLRWADIDLAMGKMKIQRQLSYVSGRPDFLDDRLKANEARIIEITAITRPFLVAARERRDALIKSGNWHPREDFDDLVLLRDDGSCEKLNNDSALFHEFMSKYNVQYRNVSPGALRHAAATYWANYGGPDQRGVTRENLRRFMGHSVHSNLDAYYARASQDAMTREFGVDMPVTRQQARERTEN
jgi:integrase